MGKNFIGISVEGSILKIDCGAFDLENDVVLGRLKELVPVLERILSADEVWHNLTDSVAESLLHDRLRYDMLFQAAVSQAYACSWRLFDLVSVAPLNE